MKIRYKKDFDNEWHTTTAKSLCLVVSRLLPTESIVVRKDCQHKNTWVESGIKTCKDCGEQLEVTSWRD